MKTKIQVLIVILLCLGQLTAQVTVDITSIIDNREVENGLYGFHMSNFFESCLCYDPDGPGEDNDTMNCACKWQQT